MRDFGTPEAVVSSSACQLAVSSRQQQPDDWRQHGLLPEIIRPLRQA